MKLLVLISFLLSFSTYAQEEIKRCNGQYIGPSNEIQAKTCAAELFFKKHTETYYGNRIFFESMMASGQKLSSYLEKIEPIINNVGLPSYKVNKKFQELIRSSEYVLLVIEEHDLRRIHVYTIDTDKSYSLNEVAAFYEDVLVETDLYATDDYPERYFGFSTESLFLSFYE